MFEKATKRLLDSRAFIHEWNDFLRFPSNASATDSCSWMRFDEARNFTIWFGAQERSNGTYIIRHYEKGS